MNEVETPVQSPCIRNCCLNEDDVCLGCYRTLLEITRWGGARSQERLLILQNAQQRRDAAGKRTHWPG